MIQPCHQSDRLIRLMIYGWGCCLIVLADLQLTNADNPAPIEVASTETATMALQIEAVTSRGKPVPGRARYPKSAKPKDRIAKQSGPGPDANPARGPSEREPNESDNREHDEDR
jgi:hypothetical protein